MKRGWVYLILLLALLASAPPFAYPAETLTNDAVITMVKAGLTEELIILKIETSPNQFDLSTANLLKLKNEGVSDRVIKAMVETEGQAQGKRAEPVKNPGSAQASVSVPSSGDIFILKEGKMQEMEYVQAKIQASMGAALLQAFFIVPKDRVAIIVDGVNSQFKITDPSPIFYSRENPANRFGIMKFVVDSEKKIRYVPLSHRAGSSSWEPPKENGVEFDTSHEIGGLYKMLPRVPLGPGEYAIFVEKGQENRLYEFSVEAPTPILK